MKNIFNISCIFIGIILICVCGCANTKLDDDHVEMVPLDFLPALSGDYFRLISNSVGRPFHIYVRLPAGYEDHPEKSYPVVYLLDGDSLFPILATNHLFLTYDDKLPEAIVVGISYGSFDGAINKRTFDFSAHASDSTSEHGGAKKFHAFLKSELIPEIELRYQVDSSKRILFGQSRGGYMVLYSAFRDPDLFWGRVASNPTLTPGRKRFFNKAKVASRHDLSLVVTSGSRDYPRLREDVLKWSKEWEGRSDAPWAIKTITIEGGTHASYSTTSYRLALNWLFQQK